MRIKLLTDTQTHKANEIVDMRPFFAKILIKQKKAIECYRVSDLCTGQLCYVEEKEDNNILYDEISDISFWLKNIKMGILIYSPPEFFKGILMKEDFYTLIVSGKKFFGNLNFRNHKVKQGDYIINSSTVKPLSEFKNELNIYGWNENSELTIKDVRLLENEININHNLYCGMSNYVR